MVSVLKRRTRAASRLSPFLATLLLTAAVFLLPAVGDGRTARASVSDIKVAATHIDSGVAAQRNAARH